MPSQNDLILEALKSGRRLTALDALNEFACMRLSARVHDLRLAGYPVQSVMIRQATRSVAQYFL